MPGVSARAKAITVLYDGTPQSRRALDEAARLAGYGSTLMIVGLGPEEDALDGEARARLARHQVAADFVPAGRSLLDVLHGLVTDVLVVSRRISAPGGVAAVVDGVACDVLVIA